ncbi:MAG: hypothetical protein U5K43_05190 [Halofilum sp. (in: g-proteobacteria)]|nr:hypothetical protein [Halofilum sp. (in: g-proteobacteria)]
MPKLDVEPTATAQWHALVQSAGADCGTRLDEPVEAYLVFMLMRFSDRTDVGRRALAIDFLEAIQEPARQADRLRDTGDECLLVCGLFPQRARRRRVPFRYYVDLGRGAYHTLARHGRTSTAEPFAALATGFVRLMEVLQAMRARAPDAALSPLDAAELALETGSERAWQQVGPDDATLVPDGGTRRH